MYILFLLYFACIKIKYNKEQFIVCSFLLLKRSTSYLDQYDNRCRQCNTVQISRNMQNPWSSERVEKAWLRVEIIFLAWKRVTPRRKRVENSSAWLRDSRSHSFFCINSSRGVASGFLEFSRILHIPRYLYCTSGRQTMNLKMAAVWMTRTTENFFSWDPLVRANDVWLYINKLIMIITWIFQYSNLILMNFII